MELNYTSPNKVAYKINNFIEDYKNSHNIVLKVITNNALRKENTFKKVTEVNFDKKDYDGFISLIITLKDNTKRTIMFKGFDSLKSVTLPDDVNSPQLEIRMVIDTVNQFIVEVIGSINQGIRTSNSFNR